MVTRNALSRSRVCSDRMTRTSIRGPAEQKAKRKDNPPRIRVVHLECQKAVHISRCSWAFPGDAQLALPSRQRSPVQTWLEAPLIERCSSLSNRERSARLQSLSRALFSSSAPSLVGIWQWLELVKAAWYGCGAFRNRNSGSTRCCCSGSR
jgi:hypothetical protein